MPLWSGWEKEFGICDDCGELDPIQEAQRGALGHLLRPRQDRPNATSQPGKTSSGTIA